MPHFLPIEGSACRGCPPRVAPSITCHPCYPGRSTEITVGWWEKMLALVVDMARDVPCYRLRFDRGGEIYRLFEEVG